MWLARFFAIDNRKRPSGAAQVTYAATKAGVIQFSRVDGGITAHCD